MRKVALFLFPFLILTILFLLVTLVINKDSGRGALQVTSVPTSQVFLSGKYIGKTPLCLCDLPQLLKTTDYDIKLVPLQNNLKSFQQKITIYQGVLTVLDRTFDPNSAASSGSLITLSPIDNESSSEILVISFPSKADVIMDSNSVGATPLLLKNITSSDHEIKVLKDGYNEKIIKVKTVNGKRLEATISLGIKNDITTQELKASASGTFVQKVTILDTPTGYLRVRKEASVSSGQVGTLNPGDEVELIDEKTDWYQVRLADGKEGWISSTYAKKNN